MERHNAILILLLIIAATGIIGCETSNPEQAWNTATVSDPRFVQALDEISSRPGQVLVCVSYWNGWQAISRSRGGGNYESYTWGEHGFRRTDDSPLIRASLAEEVYDYLLPLDSAYHAASLDYSQVLDTKKNWKMINKILYVLPVPSLMAIKIEDAVRPLWVLPYRSWPGEGNAAVLADDGSVLNSVRLDRGGLRE